MSNVAAIRSEREQLWNPYYGCESISLEMAIGEKGAAHYRNMYEEKAALRKALANPEKRDEARRRLREIQLEEWARLDN